MLLRNGSLKEAGRRKQARDRFHFSLHPSLPSLKLYALLSALQLSALQLSAAAATNKATSFLLFSTM